MARIVVQLTLYSHINCAVLKYLPSKKIIIPLICISLTAGAWWFFANRQKQLPVENQIAAVNNNNAGETLSKDSDNDGLKDWEEILWKTDAHNPDTDGDGTTDNHEILAKRDPRKPGPDDEITIPSTDSINGIATAIAGEKENFTAKLAQNFATAYFSRKLASASNGNALIEKDTLTNQVFSDITNSMGAYSFPDSFQATTDSSFHIKDSNNDADVRAYVNILAKTLQEQSSPQKHELEIINAVFANRTFNSLGQLEENSVYYKSLANTLYTIDVPRLLLEAHKNMANSFLRLSIILDTVSQFNADPISGFAALNQYVSEAQESAAPLEIIMREVKTRNIAFQESEPGAMFNKYLSAFQ